MTSNRKFSQIPVAIIGMGGMFAGSQDLKAYWHTIFNGVDRICDPPASHHQLNDYLDRDPKKPDHIYCNRGGFLPTIDFDPTEFGIPPTALEATDTSQLLGLVGAKMALADAGYGDGNAFDRERTSVIIGVTGTQELVISLGSRLGHPLWRRALLENGLDDRQVDDIIQDIGSGYVPWQENSFPGLLGNVVAGRICNRLNLGGTNCVVDAACASSLSALHLALMELTSGKSNMVVTGGVDTINDIFMHMCFSKTGVLSHSGDARPFSANADGTVLGEGIGLIVLKRLDDAKRDKDRIYAVIRGIGSASDGKSQSIYAPRVEGQARALVDAYHQADVTPDTVSLIEAHGTGTRVGDEVEFTALKGVFGEYRSAANPCALGSVKSMIGHTKAAAGAAGLIKASLALHHKVLPPTIKADPPDPKLDIEASPFYLNTIARPWLNESDTPRRCGVSSFGFGGSNFHVVLEEYQAAKSDVAWDGSVEILAFSGPTGSAVADAVQKASDSLDNSPGPVRLNRLARTSRADFKTTHAFRLAMILETTTAKDTIKKRFKDALACIGAGKPATLPAQGIYFATPATSAGKVAFMFPGQGSQYVYMGRDLVCMFPEAMATVEAASRVVENRPGLGERIFPQPAGDNTKKQEQSQALRQTDVAQPAIGTISLAMLAALDYFGLRPDATCGHSYGELPALYAAGWIDRDTLLQLSATRGSLMALAGKGTDAGTMLAVKAGADALTDILANYPDVVLANINSPDQRVLSGPSDAIEAVKAACDQKGIRSVVLPVAAAFHSPLVDSAAAPFAQRVATTRFTPSAIPVYANLTAAPYPAESQEIVDILSRQMTSPVQFQQMIQHLYDNGVRTFIEVGPKSVLCGLVRSILNDVDASAIALDRSSGKATGVLDLAHTIAQLAALGANVDLTRWEQESPHERTPKMVVPLSGANYRAPRASKPKPDPNKTKREKTIAPPTAQTSASPSSSAPVPPPEMRKPPEPMKPTTPTQMPVTGEQTHGAPPTPDMNTALSVVQKGLESIQALQQQTAQAHQKFLDTQSQASRTLQEMMKSTQALVGSLTGMPAPRMDAPSADPQPVAPLHTPPPLVQATAPIADTALPHPVAKAGLQAAAPLAPPAQSAAPATSQPSQAAPAVSSALLEIVSELTGYPVEMLGLDMDIESDLGIDSIKRVEILSAMEEKMPHLPQVTPDMVGTLKTLGQICDFLAQGQSTSPPAATETIPQAPPATMPAADSGMIQDTLLTIVAELTGYPVEMLGLDMDIESDLGIDSIKRVEILSAMEEKMPHLPQVTPDMVGTLKTLGQICDFLAQGQSTSPPAATETIPQAPPATMPAADSGMIQDTLLTIVAELTGYPVEMLGLDMDIESDLGIDSIKRVEILSAMEEKMPHLPQVTPDMVGTLKTLGQICDFLAQGQSTSPPAATETIPQAAPATMPAADSGAVQARLLAIVAELTGYPVEMLGLDMDIESDLGIDSIKRVEILSAMEEKMPHLPQVTPDMVGTLKTLGQICDFLAGSNQPAPSPVTEDKPTPTDAAPQPLSTTIPRQIVDVRSMPKAPGRTLHIENGRKILVIDDGSAYAPAMVKQLQAKGIDAQSIAMDIVDQTQGFKGIAGLILCPMTPPESAFLAAKHAAAELTQAAQTGDALFACLTCLDGAFGFSGNAIENPIQGALPGLVKTAALEWQDVVCRAIDLAPSFSDTDVAAKQVVDELLTVAPHDPVEIGLGPDDRTILCPVPAEVAEGPLHLGPKDVIVITGGARGVTAACALALARQANGASLALIGRSTPPEPIPDWLQAADSEGAMKKRIIKHAFGGNPPTPKELESEYRRQIANMEINRTLDALQKAGVNAAYFSADVTDAKGIASSLTTIRRQMGPITGLIHGAGVLHDRLIADKSIHQFRQVYATKVYGLINVLNALESDPLGYLVLFSSVSARTGNTGQCDYAMANEVLNKLARIESMRRPDCRVTAINWGPWDGGMVTASLKNAFAKMDISLIPLEMGAATLVAEMANADPSPIEVLVGSMLTDESADADAPSDVSMALLERRELDLHRYPVLESHVIGGRPVVPFALISEWIGHGALKENPGFALHGLDDFRLLSGIRVDQSGKLVRLMAGKPKRSGDVWQVDVELRNGVKNGKDVIHSRAKAVLVDRFPDAPPFTGNGKNGSRPYPRQVNTIYQDILFHGDRLRAIETIDEYSDHGMTAKLVAAPKPEVWMQDPIQEHWMADPMVLDGAFQMAIVWCFEQTGKVCLPSYTRTYRQYRSAFPSGGAKAVMTVTSQSQRKMVADFTFLDHDDQVVATLSGYEAIIDDALMHAFKNNGLPSIFKGDQP